MEQRRQDIDITRVYLDTAGEVDLLTKEDEYRLGSLVQAGLHAKHVITNYPEAFADDRNLRQLYVQCVREGEEAHSQMVDANLLLVVSVAKKYQRQQQPHMEYLDLIQEGNLGLMHAVNKFDPTKGFKFSTYATWWIKQRITRSVKNQFGSIRLPVHMHDDIRQVQSVRHELYVAQEPYDDASVASFLDWDIDRVKEARESHTTHETIVSLHQEIDEGGRGTSVRELQDMVGDPASLEEFPGLKGVTEDDLDYLFKRARLTDEEKEVLKLAIHHKQVEIAELMGLTLGQVQSRRKTAKEKLNKTIFKTELMRILAS